MVRTMFSWKRKNKRKSTTKLLFLKKSNWNIMPKSTVRSADMRVSMVSHVNQESQYADSYSPIIDIA